MPTSTAASIASACWRTRAPISWAEISSSRSPPASWPDAPEITMLTLPPFVTTLKKGLSDVSIRRERPASRAVYERLASGLLDQLGNLLRLGEVDRVAAGRLG